MATRRYYGKKRIIKRCKTLFFNTIMQAATPTGGKQSLPAPASRMILPHWHF